MADYVDWRAPPAATAAAMAIAMAPVASKFEGGLELHLGHVGAMDVTSQAQGSTLGPVRVSQLHALQASVDYAARLHRACVVQEGTPARRRAAVLATMMQLAHAWGMSAQTCSAAVARLDAFVATSTEPLSSLDLYTAAMACLHMAAKLDEVQAIPISELLQTIPEVTPAMAIEMQAKILHTCGWRADISTSAAWVLALCHEVGKVAEIVASCRQAVDDARQPLATWHAVETALAAACEDALQDATQEGRLALHNAYRHADPAEQPAQQHEEATPRPATPRSARPSHIGAAMQRHALHPAPLHSAAPLFTPPAGRHLTATPIGGPREPRSNTTRSATTALGFETPAEGQVDSPDARAVWHHDAVHLRLDRAQPPRWSTQPKVARQLDAELAAHDSENVATADAKDIPPTHSASILKHPRRVTAPVDLIGPSSPLGTAIRATPRKSSASVEATWTWAFPWMPLSPQAQHALRLSCIELDTLGRPIEDRKRPEPPRASGPTVAVALHTLLPPQVLPFSMSCGRAPTEHDQRSRDRDDKPCERTPARLVIEALALCDWVALHPRSMGLAPSVIASAVLLVLTTYSERLIGMKDAVMHTVKTAVLGLVPAIRAHARGEMVGDARDQVVVAAEAHGQLAYIPAQELISGADADATIAATAHADETWASIRHTVVWLQTMLHEWPGVAYHPNPLKLLSDGVLRHAWDATSIQTHATQAYEKMFDVIATQCGAVDALVDPARASLLRAVHAAQTAIVSLPADDVTQLGEWSEWHSGAAVCESSAALASPVIARRVVRDCAAEPPVALRWNGWTTWSYVRLSAFATPAHPLAPQTVRSRASSNGGSITSVLAFPDSVGKESADSPRVASAGTKRRRKSDARTSADMLAAALPGTARARHVVQAVLANARPGNSAPSREQGVTTATAEIKDGAQCRRD